MVMQNAIKYLSSQKIKTCNFIIIRSSGQILFFSSSELSAAGLEQGWCQGITCVLLCRTKYDALFYTGTQLSGDDVSKKPALAFLLKRV